MSKSKLPVPQRREHDSPPVKNRKALNELTEMINHSPKYAAKAASESPQNASFVMPKLEMSRTRKLPVAQHHQKSGIVQPMQIPPQMKERMRSLSEQHSGLRLRDTKPRTGRFSSLGTTNTQELSMKHGGVSVEERLLKLATVEREKLFELEKKIRAARGTSDEIEKIKSTLMKGISKLKSEIGSTEVGIINIEDKLESTRLIVQKEKIHDEQMCTLKLKEIQNQLLREQDEFKAMMEQELANARDYKDEQSQQEIVTLEFELKEITREVELIRTKHEEKLTKEKLVMEEEMNKLIKMEEHTGEELSKHYETKMSTLNKMNEELDGVQANIDDITNEVKKIDEELQLQRDAQSGVTDAVDKLLAQISGVKEESSILEDELSMITQEANEVDQRYKDSLDRLRKERHFRRRIENSIEDIQGKHRVYVVVPEKCQVKEIDHNPSLQQLIHDDATYEFNKIFHASDELICEETCSLMESVFTGCNVSFIITGGDDSDVLSNLMKQSKQLISERQQKWIQRGWSFDYSVQSVKITERGVFDLLDDSPCEIKLENRSVVSRSPSRPFDDVIKFYTSDPSNLDSSTLIKMCITATSKQKSFTSFAYFLDLSHIESSPLIRQSVTKIELLKCGTMEFENPMYQLVHQLYANTKIITMINLSESLDVNWLNLGRFIQQVDVVPVKRVYSKITSTTT